MPSNWFRKLCCRLYFANDDRREADLRFEITITVAIIVNTVIMCLQLRFSQPDAMTQFLFYSNLFFTILFTLEAIVKLVAMQPAAYFQDHWNKFDFVLVPVAYITLFVAGPGTNSIRTFRVARVLRLIKRAKGLQRLFNTLMYALPQLLNVTILLLLIIFIFAVIGVDRFAQVATVDDEPTSQLTTYFNFRNAGYAMTLLFQIATGEQWWGVMQSCMITPSNSVCTDAADNCGSYWALPYFMLYMVCANSICINLFIFVLVDNYMEVQQLADPTSTEALAVVDMFRREWSLLDRHATELLRWDSFVMMLRRLPEQVLREARGSEDKNGGPMPPSMANNGNGTKTEAVDVTAPTVPRNSMCPSDGAGNFALSFFAGRCSEAELVRKLRYMDIPVNAAGLVRYKDCIHGLTKDMFGLDNVAWREASLLLTDEDITKLDDCFKVHHAFAARKIVHVFKVRQYRKKVAHTLLTKVREKKERAAKAALDAKPRDPARVPSPPTFPQGKDGVDTRA